MRAYHGYFFGCIPILVVAPRMVALYSHTALNCYATTDYTNYRDFSFGVRRYVVFKIKDDSDKVTITADGDTIIFEAGASVPEIQTLDALFKEVAGIAAEIGVCEQCGRNIGWIAPAYMDVMSQVVISIPGSNRRILSSFCIECLMKKKNGGDRFCQFSAST